MHYLELKIILQHIKNRCMYMATRHNSNPITHSSDMSVLLSHIFRRLQIAAKVSHRFKVLIYSYFEILHIYLQFQGSFQPPKGLIILIYVSLSGSLRALDNMVCVFFWCTEMKNSSKYKCGLEVESSASSFHLNPFKDAVIFILR